MRYLKLFESFDGDNFIIDSTTTSKELTDFLYEKLDEHSNFGSDSTFTSVLENIIVNSLMSKEKMDEDKASSIVSKFVEQNFRTGQDTIEDEYDDYGRRYEGFAKFGSTEIFTWSSGGDGYGYSGSLKKEDVLLKGIQEFLESWYLDF